MDKRGSLLLLSMIAATFNGCGDASLTEKMVDYSGRVADGYLSGAKTCLDLNENRQCDANEPYGISDANGRFVFDALESQVSHASLVAEISALTIDLDNNQPVGAVYTLSAPANSHFISPVTSVLQSVLEEDTQLTISQAETIVRQSFGIGQNSSLLGDYIEKGDTSVHEVAQKIAVVLSEGIKEAQQITGATDEDNLDSENFKQIYGVILKKVIQSADDIRTLSLEAVKSRSQTVSGGFFNWNDANNLEKEIQDKELENSKQPGHVEKIATQGFHHIQFDHQKCQNQNATLPESLPIPGGTDITDYPLPLGTPLSAELGNLPTCTPDVQLTSVQANNDLLTESLFQFDPLIKNWTAQPGTLNSEIQLSDKGEWVNINKNESQISFNKEGTAIIVTGYKQQEILLQTADLSGKQLSLTYSGDDEVATSTNNKTSEEASYENRIAAAAATRVFPPGAQAIRRSFKQLNKTYQIPNIFCQKESTETYNGNCNIIHKPDGNAATAIDADMFFLSANTPTNSQYSFQVGIFKIHLQLTNEQTANSPNFNTGPVRFLSVDSVTKNETIETGQWIKSNLQGVDLYTIELPSSTHAGTDNDRIKTLFFTQQNGYIRQGIVSSKGDVQIDGNWFVNNEALNSLTSLLQSL